MRFLLCVAGGFALAGLYHSQASATPAQDCKKPVYLTFDTGHMAVAPVIADILARQKVVVTFFAANEKTIRAAVEFGNNFISRRIQMPPLLANLIGEQAVFMLRRD